MNKLKAAAATIAITMIGGTAMMYKGADSAETAPYRTVPLARTDVKATVTATGTLSAVRTVQVGTQVSGQIAKLYVDFNDKVTQGQLLATIDPKLQQQAVEDAEAQVERAEATLQQAKADFERNQELFEAKVMTAAEFGTSKSNLAVQQASLKQAHIALNRAKQNLSYTSIYAPISGVIVERNVDVGQTVAASLSAPQLFLIANDLAEMQILASVDEGDIGVIKNGLPVQFTVQAFPSQTFKGTVKQVRLQSVMLENVVSYTAVVSVKNDDGRLRPGMTATVQFQTATAKNALAVPNSALRITPTEEMKTAAGLTDTAGARPNAGANARGGGRGGPGGFGARRPAITNTAMLWTVDSLGRVEAIPVQTGLTDGQKTVVHGPKLEEGLSVIVGLNVTGDAAPGGQGRTNNPLQPQRGGGRGRFGGGF